MDPLPLTDMKGATKMSELVTFWSPIVIAVDALIVIPFFTILSRVGISPWFAFCAIVPLFAILLLWIVAFRRHPFESDTAERTQKR